MRRIVVNPHRRDVESKKFSQVIESEILYKVDFTLSATDRGTTVSSVAWSSEGSRNLTFSGETLSSGVAEAYISSSYSGHALAKVVATYADGNTETQYLHITVNDPEYSI